jgi:hypothetical protein
LTLLPNKTRDKLYTANSAELEDSNEEVVSLVKDPSETCFVFGIHQQSRNERQHPLANLWWESHIRGGSLPTKQREKSPAWKGMALVNAATCYDRSKSLKVTYLLLAQLHPSSIRLIYYETTSSHRRVLLDQLLFDIASRGPALASLMKSGRNLPGRVVISRCPKVHARRHYDGD